MEDGEVRNGGWRSEGLRMEKLGMEDGEVRDGGWRS